MNLEELYKLYATGGSQGADARAVIAQTHWLSSLVEFDKRTGDALPTSLSPFLEGVLTNGLEAPIRDRLWMICEHSRESVIRLLRSLKDEPGRESTLMPIRKVRELDTASFVALSRRPGRNIRQKLADKPYMQAVRHYQTVDIPENRLFKAYVTALLSALELRVKYLGDEDELLPLIKKWLRTDEARSIGPWLNLAPNNALLSHRDYRRIWDSWGWLQKLDSAIDRDCRNVSERAATVEKWLSISEDRALGKRQFAEMPITFDWDNFKINEWDESLPSRKRPSRLRGEKAENEFPAGTPVCVDITQLFPPYSISPNEERFLEDCFVWQSWGSGEDRVDISLFDADAVYYHKDSRTVTSAHLFFSHDTDSALLDRAAREFSIRLKKRFPSEELVFVTPDCINEFKLQILRRNINAQFSRAIPLPCSIAAVFQCKELRYEKIERPGYSVAVVETVDGKLSVTEVVARYDEGLEKALPETRGYYWERCLPLIENDENGFGVDVRSLPTVGDDLSWSDIFNPHGAICSGEENLAFKDKNGNYDLIIAITSRPVKGGIRLYNLQKQAKGHALWMTRIPKLMTIAVNESTGQSEEFSFVDRRIPIAPEEGVPIPIGVDEKFRIPRGKKRFDLYQGTNEKSEVSEEALEYVATLKSPDIPFNEDVLCSLSMTYTYGEDNPYHLVFIPDNPKYEDIQVEWDLKGNVDIDDVPGPEYPPVVKWEDQTRHWNPKRKEYVDLLEWALGSIDRFVFQFIFRPREGIVKKGWSTDRQGKRHLTADVAKAIAEISEDSLVGGCTKDRILNEGECYFVEINPGNIVYASTELTDTARWYLQDNPNSHQHLQRGTVISDWLTDRNGYDYVKVEHNGDVYFVYEGSLADEQDAESIVEGGEVCFFLLGPRNRRKCRYVAGEAAKSVVAYLSDHPEKRRWVFPRMMHGVVTDGRNGRDQNPECLKVAYYRHEDVWIWVDSLGDASQEAELSEGKVFFCYQGKSKDGKPSFRSVSTHPARSAESNWNYLTKRLESRQEELLSREDEICKHLQSSLYVPFLNIWSDGRSMHDADCPNEFRDKMTPYLECVSRLSKCQMIPPSVRDEMVFLLACAGKDVQDEVSQELAERIQSIGNSAFKGTMKRAFGVALGDLSYGWQKGMLQWLINAESSDALVSLGQASWRSKAVIESMSDEEIDQLLKKSESTAKSFQPQLHSRNQLNWEVAQDVASILELILALLRTRNSMQANRRLITQPYNREIKSLANIVDQLMRDKSFCIFALRRSRIKMTLPCSVPRGTPIFLFALALYLTGDGRINGIRITGVAEGEDEDE